MSDSTKPKAVVFGAGATGRGHVGLLVWQTGAQMAFADIDEGLIGRLQKAGGYRVNLHDGRTCQSLDVQGARFLAAQEREKVAREIIEADLVLTSVFDQNLSDVAITVAQAARLCRQAGRAVALNFVACENMQNSSSTLGRHVRALLCGEDLDYCEEYFGFPDCMISRVVPRPEPDPLVITAEDYNEWTARAEAFRLDPFLRLMVLAQEVVDKFGQILHAERIPDQPVRLLRRRDEAGGRRKRQGSLLVPHDHIHLLFGQEALRLFPQLFLYIFHCR